jgi:hypothetical protein
MKFRWRWQDPEKRGARFFCPVYVTFFTANQLIRDFTPALSYRASSSLR